MPRAKKGAKPANSTSATVGYEAKLWRLAKTGLAIRGSDGRIEHGDTFHNDRHPDLKADYVLANPPFYIFDWGGERLSRGCPDNYEQCTEGSYP